MNATTEPPGTMDRVIEEERLAIIAQKSHRQMEVEQEKQRESLETARQIAAIFRHLKTIQGTLDKDDGSLFLRLVRDATEKRRKVTNRSYPAICLWWEHISSGTDGGILLTFPGTKVTIGLYMQHLSSGLDNRWRKLDDSQLLEFGHRIGEAEKKLESFISFPGNFAKAIARALYG